MVLSKLKDDSVHFRNSADQGLIHFHYNYISTMPLNIHKRHTPNYLKLFWGIINMMSVNTCRLQKTNLQILEAIQYTHRKLHQYPKV